MTSWQSGAKADPKAHRKFGKDLLKIADDIKLVGNGNIMIAMTTFREWRKKVLLVPANQKQALAEELLILSRRYFRAAGEQANQVVDQLIVLSCDLIGAKTKTPAKKPAR